MRTSTTLSFGMRAAVASIVAHGTIAAAVATRVLSVPAEAPNEVVVDLQREPVAPPPPPATPPPSQTEPALPRASATLDSHPHHERISTSKAALPEAEQASPPPATVPEVLAAAPGTPVASFTIAMPSGGDGSGSGPEGATRVAGAPTHAADIVDVSGPSALADRVYGPSPVYPREAQEARIEGDVPLLILVDPTGRVTDVRVQHAAGFGLDQAAVAAVRQWTFKPRMHNGEPVAVRVTWTMQFRLD